MAPKNLRDALSSRNVPPAVQDDEADVNLPFGDRLRKELEQKAHNEPLREITLDKLLDNPYQHLARTKLELGDEALQELAKSILELGFHGALLARPKAGQAGYFELAFGHRRKEAARLAGLSKLPVKILELSNSQMLKIMAGENFARLDLNPLNEALVVGEIYNSENLSAREIAEIVGKNRNWVEARLALYSAPQIIKNLITTKPNTIGHVVRLVGIKDSDLQKILVQEILDKNLTQSQLNDRIKELKPSTATAPEQITLSTPLISTSAIDSPIAANPSPVAPTPTAPTPAATHSAAPTPVPTAGAGPAPSPASAGSSPNTQQLQPQPPAPMPGSASVPAPQQQPPYPPLPPMTAPPSVGPIPGVANPAGFATVDEFLKLEAKVHAAANDTSLGQVTPAEDSDSDDLLEQTFGYGDEFGDGGNPQSDLSDLYAASTNIEDYLPQPASAWGILVAQLAVDAARLENMGQSVEALSMMTTGEWEVLDRTIRQLQSLFAKLG